MAGGGARGGLACAYVCVYAWKKKSASHSSDTFFSPFKCALQMSATSSACREKRRDSSGSERHRSVRTCVCVCVLGRRAKWNPCASVSSLYEKLQQGGAVLLEGAAQVTAPCSGCLSGFGSFYLKSQHLCYQSGE